MFSFSMQADYFKVISQKLAQSTGVDAAKIGLYFNNQLLDHYDSLKTVPIRITDIIGVFVKFDNVKQNYITVLCS